MKLLKRWMNLNRMTKKFFDHQNSEICYPGNTHTHMLCQILLQNWHIFHQFAKTFARIFFPFWIFCNVPFSFDMAKHILWNLKNGIKWTQKKKLLSFFLRCVILRQIYMVIDCFINIWKFWRKILLIIIKILQSSSFVLLTHHGLFI